MVVFFWLLCFFWIFFSIIVNIALAPPFCQGKEKKTNSRSKTAFSFPQAVLFICSVQLFSLFSLLPGSALPSKVSTYSSQYIVGLRAKHCRIWSHYYCVPLILQPSLGYQQEALNYENTSGFVFLTFSCIELPGTRYLKIDC